MEKKIILILIVLGVISVGTATYALFSENMLLDATSNVATNDSSLHNNQSDIQNNQSNIQNNQSNIKSNQSNNIANNENSNLSFNNKVNSVLNDTNVVNNSSGEKVAKEILRIITKDRVHTYYDDSTWVVIMDNRTFHYRDGLTRIYDTDSLSGGYIACADCGKFIPVGDVSGLVPENYLCKCPDEHPKNIKEVSFVYSEENILEGIKVGLQPCSGSPIGYAEIPVNDTLEDGSTNTNNGDSNSSSTPESDRGISNEYNIDPDFVPEFYPNDPHNPNYFEHGTGYIPDRFEFVYNQEPMTD